MGIVRFALRYSLLLNLLTVFVVGVGLMKIFGIRREAFPSVNFDIVFVQTTYPGASPREVELDITNPLEEELAKVDGIDEMTSVSTENFGLIVLKLDPDADDGDKDETINDIQRAVDRTQDLPDDLPDPPLVRELESGDMPIIELGLSGLPYPRLHEEADRLADRLADLPDVQDVVKMGFWEKEVWVEVDPRKLRSYEISLRQVIGALAARNLNLPGGTIETGEGELLVRTVGEIERPGDLGDIILRANDAGVKIRVRDTGKVRESYEEPSRVYRTNAEPSINLLVLKNKRGDVIRMVDKVLEISEGFRKTVPEASFKIERINDVSLYVRNRLSVLINNGLMGMALVLITLLVGLSPGVAFVTALGVPVAFLATFIVMSYAGMTMNLVSMFGLILVSGMLVDDAIIFAENIWHHFEEGENARDAVIKGASEVLVPVMGTILTTIAAFLPLAMMSGIFGKFISEIPKVVICSLSMSLLEAVLVLPPHAYDVLRWREARGKRGRGDTAGRAPAAERGLRGGLMRAYEASLRLVLRFRYVFVVLIVGVFAGTLWFAQNKMKFILFPAHGIEIFFVRAELPPGSSLHETAERFRPLEALVASLPEKELKDFITTIGVQQQDPNDPFTRRGSHLGQLAVYLTNERERERTADQIIEALRGEGEAIRGESGFARLVFERARPGPPTGKPVAIRIMGEDLGELNALAEEVRGLLPEIPGVRDIDKDFTEGKEELQVVIDEAAASQSLLTVQDVALHVRAAFEGHVATYIREGTERVAVRIRYPESDRKRVRTLSEVSIPNAVGNLIPLDRVAHVQRRPGIKHISHRDERRVITVTADVDETVTTSTEANRTLAPKVAALEVAHPGVRMTAGGEWEDTAESLESLREAFLVALGLVFVILVPIFRSFTQPLIVMASIPFGIIGVIWAFYFHGLPIGFLGMVGAIGLAGVVVNDSIVLVDFTNVARSGGMPVFEAAVYAGKRRFRAVWLTTLTTVFGLLPLVYGIGGEDRFIAPAAVSLGYGLLFGTVLVLFFTPALYLIRSDVGRVARRIMRMT